MFYSYLRSKTRNTSSIGPLKDGENTVSSDSGMANVLNNFFATVFTIENDDLPDQVPCDLPEKLEYVEFPENSVREKINKLKPDSAYGPDKIGSRVLHATADI